MISPGMDRNHGLTAIGVLQHNKAAYYFLWLVRETILQPTSSIAVWTRPAQSNLGAKDILPLKHVIPSSALPA